MKVLTIQILTTAKGKIPPGTVIDIPGHLFERLQGKVEPIREALPFHGAAEIVTKEGQSFWVATEEGAVNLIPAGAPFFLPDEIERLHRAGEEAARFVLEIKRHFSKAIVVETKKGRNHYR